MKKESLLNRIIYGFSQNKKAFFAEWFSMIGISYTFLWGLFELPYSLFQKQIVNENDIQTKWILLITFFIISFIYSSFRIRRKTDITINFKDKRTKVEVCFGNIFEFDGFKAIPMSRFFYEGKASDLIREKSLPPQLIEKYFNNDFDYFKKTINNALKDKKYDIVERDGRQDRSYEIGTTIPLKQNNDHFLLFALTQTELAQFKTENNADLTSLTKSIFGLLETARKYSGGNPLNLPLIGSGVSGIDLPHNKILELNLLAIVEACKKGHITDTIRIIILYDKFKDIDLKQIKRAWTIQN